MYHKEAGRGSLAGSIAATVFVLLALYQYAPVSRYIASLPIDDPSGVWAGLFPFVLFFAAAFAIGALIHRSVD